MAFGDDTQQPPGDFDGLPGSDENTRSYDRIYDSRGVSETRGADDTEQSDLLNWNQLVNSRNAYLKESRAANHDGMNRVQFWPDVGKFVIPPENTFAAHQQLIRADNNLNIDFNPDRYAYFDRILMEHAGRRDVFDPSHPDFLKYAQARENIAALRNDIMGTLLSDGAFNTGDEVHLPKLAGMAATIGDALHSDIHPLGFVFARLNANMLNIEGEGAAYAYEFLEKHQASDTMLGKVWARVREFFSQPPRRWGLPPIALSAFSHEKLDMPPPEDNLCAACAGIAANRHYAAQAREATLNNGNYSEEQLAALTLLEKREAIDHGRTILDWLKKLQFTNQSLTEWMGTGSPIEKAAEKQAMVELVGSYYEVVEGMVRGNMSKLHTPKMHAASQVVETLEHSLTLMAKLEKSGGNADAMQIRSDDEEPIGYRQLANQSVNQLMRTLEAGIDEAVQELEAQEVAMEQEQEMHLAESMGHVKQGKAGLAQRAVVQNQKQRTIERDLRLDDRVRGEGQHAQNRPPEKRPINFKGIDKAISGMDNLAGAKQQEVKALGKQLMNMHHAGKQAAAQAADDIGMVKPTDQTFAQQKNQERDFNKPNGIAS